MRQYIKDICTDIKEYPHKYAKGALWGSLTCREIYIWNYSSFGWFAYSTVILEVQEVRLPVSFKEGRALVKAVQYWYSIADLKMILR